MEVEKRRASELGGSIPVDSVQDLAAKVLDEIPERYIRPEIEVDPHSSDDQLEIPVVDLCRLLDQRFSKDEMTNLHDACRDWGFFQLVAHIDLTNHGVADELLERMKADTAAFFKMPFDEKMAHAQLPNNLEGYGQAFVVSEKQKLDWGDMLFLLPRPISSRKMRFWPTNPPTFRDTMDNYSSNLQRVAIHLLRLMAKNLGIDPETLTNMFLNGTQGIRMNYYPPCKQADKVLGLSPHSDATGLTLLLQDNEVHGLQIKKNGKWIAVKPIPGAFTVNIGDVLEILSNGAYKSIEHRAVINKEKERLSIAAFHSLEDNVTVGPLPELVTDSDPCYKSVNHEDYVRLVVTRKLDGKSNLDFMKLKK